MLSAFAAGASPVLLLEYWKPVVGFESRYEISNTGRIWNKELRRTMSCFLDKDGYLRVGLRLNGRHKQAKLHRLVGDAFIGPLTDGLTTNHKNTWKRKNWVSNLEYITNLENLLHARENGLGRNKLSYDDVRQIRSLSQSLGCAKLGEMYSVTPRAIQAILSKTIYRDLV